MGHPLAIVIVAALCATSAQAQDRYVPPELPVALRASPAQALPHNPSPFPDEQEIEFRGDGPNGWAILAGVLGAGAAVSGLVSAASAAQLGSSDTPPAERPKLRRTRNAAGYTAIGLAAGSGICLGIAIAI